MGRRSFPGQEQSRFIIERIIGGSSDGAIQKALTEYGPSGRVKPGEYGAYSEVGFRTIANIRQVVNLTREQVKEDEVVSSPWVQNAQQLHLFGVEKGAEWDGLNVIIYKEVGVRQHLEFFKGCFSDINPGNRQFWTPLSDHDSIVIELRGHLPDEGFWSQVEDFSQQAKECECLLDSAYEKFTSVGEELAPLKPSRGPDPDAYITSAWARRILVRALSRELRLKESGEYHHQKLPDGGFMLEDDGLIYVGPDDVAAEQRHYELVNHFINTEEFSRIVNLMKQLRDLRQQIIARINRCLYDKEYVLYYCPSCPAAEKARRRGSR